MLELYPSMDLRLVHIMVIKYDYDMGNRLEQNLMIYMDFHLVRMRVQI